MVHHRLVRARASAPRTPAAPPLAPLTPRPGRPAPGRHAPHVHSRWPVQLANRGRLRGRRRRGGRGRGLVRFALDFGQQAIAAEVLHLRV